MSFTSLSLHPIIWYLATELQHVLDLDAIDCALLARQLLSLCTPPMLPLATIPSRQLLCLFGTVCRSQYEHHRHCQFSAVD